MKRIGSGKSRIPAAARRCHAGLTLIELMMVLSIVAVLVGLGVPAARGMMNTGESTATMLKLQGMIQLARSQAIKNKHEVTFCGTTDGSRCNRAWYGKTLVFADLNRNRNLDNNEPLYADEGIEIKGHLRWRASAGRHYLRFTAEGWVKEFGTLTYCPGNNRAQHAKALIISFTGRARASRDTDGDGIREDSSGRPITCV